MKRIVLLALAAAAACAPASKHNVSVVIDADFTTGKVTLTCRDSSSGTCHVLFATAGEPVRLSAAKGASAEANGLGDGARFCVGDAAPGNGCKLSPLRDGEQIIRNSVVKTG